MTFSKTEVQLIADKDILCCDTFIFSVIRMLVVKLQVHI